MKHKRNFNKTLFVKYVLLHLYYKASTGHFKKYSLAFNVSKKIKHALSVFVCCLNWKDQIEKTKIVFWNNCPARWIFFDLSIRLTKQLLYILLIKKANNNFDNKKVCFHSYLHFAYVPIYTFGFHHKQCANDYKDFTFVKFTTQLSVALMNP